MNSNVVKLEPVQVGEGYRFEAGKILAEAQNEKFDRLAIIGELENGELYITGTANAGETLILMERVKRKLIFGDVDG